MAEALRPPAALGRTNLRRESNLRNISLRGVQLGKKSALVVQTHKDSRHGRPFGL